MPRGPPATGVACDLGGRARLQDCGMARCGQSGDDLGSGSWRMCPTGCPFAPRTVGTRDLLFRQAASSRGGDPVQALLTGLGVFLGTVLISSIGAAVRASGARRRHAVSGVGGVTTGLDGGAGGVPVRLCGVALTYPGPSPLPLAGMPPARWPGRARRPRTGSGVMRDQRRQTHGKPDDPPAGCSAGSPTGTQTRIAVHRVAMAVATPTDDRSGHWTRRTDRPSPQSVARPFAGNLQGVDQ